jgi:hypothetical protein
MSSTNKRRAVDNVVAVGADTGASVPSTKRLKQAAESSVER